MPQKRLTTNGNVFRRTDGRWQSVIWYFDEQGIKRRKVFSSKTKTEAQQKITTYIASYPLAASFQIPLGGADNIRPAGMHSSTPSIPAHRGENRGGHYSGRPEICAEPLDGARLRLHHGEESTYTPQRVFPLPHRGGLHPEEPHAVRPHDEACQLSSGPGQRVCAGAGSRHGIHSNRDCEIHTSKPPPTSSC